MESKTGILCHGRHVLANNWELHQWGDKEKGLLGQVLKTLSLAAKQYPEVVVFGTGASEKDGLKESEYTIRYMFEHFDEINEFPQFNGADMQGLKNFMSAHSVPEKKSQNTLEELKCAMDIFSSYSVSRIFIVSNPDHISRCMQLAHQVYHDLKPRGLDEIFAAQSDVGYNGTLSVTSKIIEMPHRGDDPSPDLSKYIGSYFRLPLEKKIEFVEQVRKFLGQ
ncbi:MAG: ElyC/SanA/YdcF family protein [Nanoarchaeota archaeon]|nr:ElyC/SanA/YdcF family protein [Nanoarchaeota archaeon]